MALIHFPDPRFASRHGLVYRGGEPSVQNLLAAYRSGIFPWPDGVDDRRPITWFSPDPRVIIEFKDLHVPRSLRREQRRALFRFTIDQSFRTVVTACARVKRPDWDSTWITPSLIRGFCALHEAGYAHSAEAWAGDELVGGLFGVDAGGVFVGDSMFYLRPNASKLALLFLLEHLRARGADWFDAQVYSPHIMALGARPVTRADYLARLAATQARGLKLFD
ncbi:MAG TPA: leucyl/phenylalanyl-tRNA--protein transferase [Pyrinomonadaceae bacterium]|jgi:leucyl/phenylalanyl-tRNA--protein transferase